MSRSNIPGRAAYLHIYDRFLASNPRPGAIVVEVGVALGKSISYIAEKCLEIGRKDIQIYAVDPWQGTAQNGEQQELAKLSGGDFSLYANMMMNHAPEAFEMVRVLRCEGWRAARLFDRVDCLVLDGDHTEEAVHAELFAWCGHKYELRPNGLPPANWRDGCIVGGDDYHAELFPGVIDAVNNWFGVDNIEVHNDEGWPTWVRK